MKFKTALNIIMIMSIAVLCIFIYFYRIPHQSSDFKGQTKYLFVRKGESINDIAQNLFQIGAISSKSNFVFFAKAFRKANHIKIGRYAIKPNNSIANILGGIVRGESVPYDITIPEGLTIAQVANILESEVEIDPREFHEAVCDQRFLDSLKISARNLEGYLAPSTYNVYFSENPRRVVSRMTSHFFESLPDSFSIKACRLGLTVNQAVTLASLVEKEARLDDERNLIAAVYLNRLRKGMKLDCDPTVIYAMGGLSRPLVRADLDFDSPYNTYLNLGLPPGPISNPGVKALEAAVNPASVGYLYFVAKGDGSHVFSYTLDDHNNAIYRIKRSNGHGM
jgi:UPF0755 protein